MSSAHFSIASSAEDKADGRFAPVAAIPTGLSGSHGGCGACRGEGLLAGEHVPDRLCQPPGDVDLGDLGAALFAEAALGALVALGVGRVPAGMGCRLDQGPA